MFCFSIDREGGRGLYCPFNFIGSMRFDLSSHVVAPKRAVCFCCQAAGKTCSLAAGVLCDSLGSLAYGVLSELSRK